VLDLRNQNAAGHLKRVRAARRSGSDADVVSVYTLDEAFWLDGLPTDPDILSAQPKAVVVGLVLGNRAKPSSTTDYSDRPKSAGTDSKTKTSMAKSKPAKA
jgi:hypothetical protein